MLVLQADLLRLPGMQHGFFGRTGGVSGGIYTSLNTAPASHDARSNIEENRSRVAAHFGPGVPLLTLGQHHSADTVVAETPWDVEDSPEGDAVVTRTPGLVVGVNTADCAPVLLADPVARIVGAAHAGWKGALGGVIESAVATMEELGADRNQICAAIGPCISQDSYEVGEDFHEAFAGINAEAFFAPGQDESHYQFDLEGFVEAQLQASDIIHIEKLGMCTLAHEDKFFSMRRSVLAGEPYYGRECSAIMLEA